jgi:hypothetical protein
LHLTKSEGSIIMKKTFLLVLFLFINILASHGNEYPDNNLTQPNNPTPLSDSKWYFGGNIGANFWNDYLLISVEPLVGYNVTPQFSLGSKLHYSFIRDTKDDNQDYIYNNFGGSVFARYFPVPQGYLHAEFNFTNYQQYSKFNSVTNKYESERVWVPAVLVGAGYRQSIGPNASVYGEVLFDVLQDKNSPFKKWEPIVHVGAAVGF